MVKIQAVHNTVVPGDPSVKPRFTIVNYAVVIGSVSDSVYCFDFGIFLLSLNLYKLSPADAVFQKLQITCNGSIVRTLVILHCFNGATSQT